MNTPKQVSWLKVAEDYVGDDGPVLDAIRAAQVLEAREPLVQAIISFHREIMASGGRWTTAEKAQGGKRMAELVTALAEWSPT